MDDRATLLPGLDIERFARDSQRALPSPAPSGTRLRSHVADPSTVVRAADLYWDRLGGPARVPRLARADLLLAPTHRDRCCGFLLCRVDGVTPLGEIIETCGLPDLTALSLACDLVDAGLLVLDEP